MPQGRNTCFVFCLLILVSVGSGLWIVSVGREVNFPNPKTISDEIIRSRIPFLDEKNAAEPLYFDRDRDFMVVRLNRFGKSSEFEPVGPGGLKIWCGSDDFRVCYLHEKSLVSGCVNAVSESRRNELANQILRYAERE